MALMRPTLVAITIVAVALSGCGGARYDTPEACFQTIRIAAHHEDIPTFCDSLTPESQELLAGGLVMFGASLRIKAGVASFLGGPIAGAGSEAQRQLDAVNTVLARHGVTEDQVRQFISNPESFVDLQSSARDLGNLVADKPAFIADMWSAIKQFDDNGEMFGKKVLERLAGEIQEVSIDGEQATAVITTKRGQESLVFHKTATGWKLHIIADDLIPA